MQLYVISGITGLNISFYISFSFLSLEIYNNYLQILLSLQQFYQKKNISELIFMSTNSKEALICALQNVILFTIYAVCFFYIDKNVFTNYKLLFDVEKSCQGLYNNWYRVLYSTTKPIFEEKQAKFQAKYKTSY